MNQYRKGAFDMCDVRVPGMFIEEQISALSLDFVRDAELACNN